MRKSCVVAPIAKVDAADDESAIRRASPRQQNASITVSRLQSHTFDPTEVLFRDNAIDAESKISIE